MMASICRFGKLELLLIAGGIEPECNCIRWPRPDGSMRRCASHRLVSLEFLQNLGSQATGRRGLRDLRHDIAEGFVDPRDLTQTKIEEEIQLATILVRRRSVGVSQIRIHGDRDCVRHLRPPLPVLVWPPEVQ